jgi:hypothetical protein
MSRRLSLEATAIILLGFSLVSWGLVALEAALTHTVSFISVGTALTFTLLVVILPFLTGTRLSAKGVQHFSPCRECGALLLPIIPTVRFCIHCGAYPKARPAAA